MTVEPLAPEQDAAEAAPLHLPDLTIKGFRGIDELKIPRLGRVTLLAGKNGVGKTTVLDAVRVYASRARYETLGELLRDRDEVSVAVGEDGGTVLEPDWPALFHGRAAHRGACISIGGPDALRIDAGARETLRVAFGGHAWQLPCHERIGQRRLHVESDEEMPPGIECQVLGPGLPDSAALARYWDGVALTREAEQAVRALRLVLGEGVDGVSMVGDDRGRREWRRPIVKLAGHERPVPLKSLGEGALRLFGIALALANSRDGFLLIDEVENGIHHKVQRDFWRMVLQTAHENNIQVLATTHSWDCVRGFAHAANENEDAEGLLVRIRRVPAGLRVVEYSEERLRVAAAQGIEVR